MATAKELKEWEERAKNLRASVKIAERHVQRETEALEKTKTYRDNCEKMLADHLRNAPVLTPKQAAKKAS